MNLIKLYEELQDREESIPKIKEEIICILNPIIKNLKLGSLLSGGDYKLSIVKKILEKDLYHFLAGYEVLEIWETKDEYEYARQYIIPLFVFNNKKYVEQFTKIKKEWEEDKKIQAKILEKNRKENIQKEELKIYRRVKRQLKNENKK